MKTSGRGQEQDWEQAVRLLLKWERGSLHLDGLLEKTDLGRVRWLVMEVFRSWLVIERQLKDRLRKPPRPEVRQLLRLALAECLNREAGQWPKIVHYAVDVARALKLSRPECGLVNGVLRGILRDHADGLKFPLEETHPAWLVENWRGQFGEAGALALLQWNQLQPELYVRAGHCPAVAEPTNWEGYYRIKPGGFKDLWPLLEDGTAYVQDPFTRIPVELLNPRPGELIIDFCAAPGGKTRLIADKLQGKGRILAVDLPGQRLRRLESNATRMPGGLVSVFGCRIEDFGPEHARHFSPDGLADAVLIDVPCSNTGVIQKRPDVKVRLQESDIKRLASLQELLLGQVAKFVRPGGRLVYSTCSLENVENRGVVETFLRNNPHWQLEQGVFSLPWECGHDGGGAFLLTRIDPR